MDTNTKPNQMITYCPSTDPQNKPGMYKALTFQTSHSNFMWDSQSPQLNTLLVP